MSRMASAMVGSSVLAAVVESCHQLLRVTPRSVWPKSQTRLFELDFIHLVIEQCQQTPSAVIYETSFWRSIRNRDIQKLPLLENQEFMSYGSSVLRAWIKSS